MRADRVVGVESESNRGSGYLIAGRLVLCSAHCVGAVDSMVSIYLAGDPRVYSATVIWQGTAGSRDDAALVLVGDSWWPSRAGGTVTFGRVVTDQAGTRAQACGFPQWVQRPNRAAELWQLSGVLNPGSRWVGDRYVMTLSGTPPVGHSPWSGLSGAAMFCGNLLTGVIAADPADGAHGYLEAVPAIILLRDARFAALVAEHGGLWEVRPAELAELAAEKPAPRTPAGLLDARARSVSFRGREGLMSQLLQWCTGTGFGAWLIHGPGGQGKTRIAQELADRLAPEWALVWLVDSADMAAIDRLRDVVVPLLVVVDYAETRGEQLAAIWQASDRHHQDTPIRVLLLARTAGDWWEEAKDNRFATQLLSGTPETPLDVLDVDPQGRIDAYRAAVTAFAISLATLPHQYDRDWQQIARRLVDTAGELSESRDRGSTSVLTLHMRALVNLLDAAESATGAPPAPPYDEPVEDGLLRHERRYWWESASMVLSSNLGRDVLADVMAAVLLLGADDRTQADTLLAHFPALADQPLARRDAVRRWLSALYPPVDSRPWGKLQPDRVAERHAGLRLVANQTLIDPLLEHASLTQRTQLLTVYARAADHPSFSGVLSESLTALCVRHPTLLALLAIDVATRVESPQPLVAALHLITDDADTSLEQMNRLVEALPDSSMSLAEWAVHAIGRIVDWNRRLASDRPDLFLPDLARPLSSLANWLGALGRRDEALEAAEESVAIRRRLAEEEPYVFLPGLASSLSNLATRRGDLGLHDEALEAIEESVAIRRRLAEAEPEESLSDLASSLNNLAIVLHTLGRREAALEAIEDSVAISRRLAANQPDDYLPLHAGCLINLTNALSDLGRQEASLEAAEQATAIYRQLAAERADAFLPSLAGSLNNLANRLGDLGRPEAALHAIEEAIAIHRQLVARLPEAFLPSLALSLNNVTIWRGHTEAALDAIEECVPINRQLAARLPAAFLPGLAKSLSNLAVHRGVLGRREAALEAIEEAVDVDRELAEGRPDAFLPGLAASLITLGIRLGAVGRRQEALEAIEESVGIARQLAADRPDAHLPDVARGLNNLATQLGEMGRREAAVDAVDEASAIYRRLVADRPEAFLPDLATSLNNLAIELGTINRDEEALRTIEDAIAICRQLVARRPDVLPNLAISLETLSDLLGALGHREEAARAIEESVEITRQLVAERLGDPLPDLARRLNKLAVRLSDLGQQHAALGAMDEATTIRRGLATYDPETFLPDLASSLRNLAIGFGALDRDEEALRATEEATEVHRQIVAHRPDAGLPYLAESLTELADRQESLGDRDAALDAIEEATQIYRKLAGGQPDVYLPKFAESLTSMAIELGTRDSQDAALATIREATLIYRQLAADRPEEFLPALAESLRLLAIGLIPEEAVEALEEAANIFRQLAEESPDDYLSDLADILYDLAVERQSVKRSEAALEAIDEAIAIHQRLTVDDPHPSSTGLDRLTALSEFIRSPG
jgi:tetratricopeptide (TPR) repeat protein